MQTIRLSVILIPALSLTLACNLVTVTTPAAPAAGETPMPTTIAPSPASPGEAPVTAAGNIYYVAPNGDNANPGTRDRPWATPGYGSRLYLPLVGRFATTKDTKDTKES